MTVLVSESLVHNPDLKLYAWCYFSDPASVRFKLSASNLLSSLITSSYSFRSFPSHSYILLHFSKKFGRKKHKVRSRKHLLKYFYFLLKQLRITSKLSASPPFMNQRFTSISGWTKFFLLSLANKSLSAMEDSTKDTFCFEIGCSSHAIYSHWEGMNPPDHTYYTLENDYGRDIFVPLAIDQ